MPSCEPTDGAISNAADRGDLVNADAVLARVDHILIHEFEVEPSTLVADARIRDDLSLDSLDGMDLVVALEKEFGVRVDEKRMLELETIGQMRDYIRGLCEATIA